MSSPVLENSIAGRVVDIITSFSGKLLVALLLIFIRESPFNAYLFNTN